MVRVLVLLLLVSGGAFGQSAQALNSEGYRLYQAKKYGEAIEKFRRAVSADGDHALAHYNLAATLALMRTKGQICEYDAYRGQILSELARAIALDPRRKARALEDSDFTSVHDTFGWQKIRGLTVEKNAPEILRAVSWYGPSPGAYGPMSALIFEEKGKVTGWSLDVSGDAPRRTERTGTWKANGAKVSIDFGPDGKREYRLDPSGRLINLAEPTDTLSDDPDDCSA